MCKAAEKEYKDNEHLLDSIANEQYKKRINTNLKWFIEHANSAKFCHYLFTIISIVTPILSGICLNISSEPACKIISSILLGMASISIAMNALFNFQKKWVIYRGQAENIKHHLTQFLYDEDLTEEKLMKLIEMDISSTDAKWNEIQKNNK